MKYIYYENTIPLSRTYLLLRRKLWDGRSVPDPNKKFARVPPYQYRRLISLAVEWNFTRVWMEMPSYWSEISLLSGMTRVHSLLRVNFTLFFKSVEKKERIGLYVSPIYLIIANYDINIYTTKIWGKDSIIASVPIVVNERGVRVRALGILTERQKTLSPNHY